MGRKPGLFHQSLIFLFFAVLLYLGVRTLVTKDSRFGWGMFAERVDYKVSYYWLYPDGSQVKYKPGKEARGLAASKVKSNDTRYGRGAVKSLITQYVHELPKIKSDSSAIGFGAILRMQINRGPLHLTDTIVNYFPKDKDAQ